MLKWTGGRTHYTWSGGDSKDGIEFTCERYIKLILIIHNNCNMSEVMVANNLIVSGRLASACGATSSGQVATTSGATSSGRPASASARPDPADRPPPIV